MYLIWDRPDKDSNCECFKTIYFLNNNKIANDEKEIDENEKHM